VVVAALEADRVANTALLLAGGLLLLAVILAVLVRVAVAKVVLAIALVVLGLVVWSQRTSLQDCAKQVRSTTPGATAKQCTFLGLKVDVTGG
jgi:hypothetical protein